HPQTDLTAYKSHPGEMVSLLLGQSSGGSELPGLWIPSDDLADTGNPRPWQANTQPGLRLSSAAWAARLHKRLHLNWLLRGTWSVTTEQTAEPGAEKYPEAVLVNRLDSERPERYHTNAVAWRWSGVPLPRDCRRPAAERV
ncbi:hypothetical protein H8959_016487, partial [Pygathrix nigripes]